MVLSLIDPVGSNFIKDFPGQNEVNLDRIDDYAGPCLITHPLKTFNPELTSSGTKPNLGVGGFSRAYYYQIFDQIYAWGEFRFGASGIDAGTGIYILNLPFTVNSILGPSTTLGSAPLIGTGNIFDASSNAGKLCLTTHLRTTSQLMFGIKFNSGLANRELREAGAITWAINDGVSWNARFQRLT